MIKEKDYQEQQATANDPVTRHVNALASALGFTFDGENYIKTVRAYTKRIDTVRPLANTRRGRRRYPNFPQGAWEPVRVLRVGQSFDVTSLMAKSGINAKTMQSRLYSFQWAEKHRMGNPGFWKLERVGTSYLIIRQA